MIIDLHCDTISVLTHKEGLNLLDNNLQVDINKHKVIIGHSDALDTANEVASMLKEKFGELDIDFVEVNPTAGSHCGPSNVGVAFYAKHR